VTLTAAKTATDIAEGLRETWQPDKISYCREILIPKHFTGYFFFIGSILKICDVVVPLKQLFNIGHSFEIMSNIFKGNITVYGYKHRKCSHLDWKQQKLWFDAH
jgi:hypothetical protein